MTGRRLLIRCWVGRFAVVGAVFVPIGPVGANNSHTAHQFAVSESGGATVTVPIQVPRGTGGMEPQLALNYSSQGGNGLVGVGWSLSGIPSITRCPQTVSTDGVRGAVRFNRADRLCLDGQRLVLANAGEYGANASEYRTERDSFSRVLVRSASNVLDEKAVVASGEFEVATKAGHIVTFGSGGRVETNFIAGTPNAGQDVINRWMATKIADRSGNEIHFFYCHGEVDPATQQCDTLKWNGSTVIHYIRYTARVEQPALFAIQFFYESRPDRVPAFHEGSRQVQGQRLRRIDTYRGWSDTVNRGLAVKRYVLAYELLAAGGVSQRATNASRLATIQEFDGASTVDQSGVVSGNSLPPLTFSLARDRVFGVSVQHVSQQPVAGIPPGGILECGGTNMRLGSRQLCP